MQTQLINTEEMPRLPGRPKKSSPIKGSYQKLLISEKVLSSVKRLSKNSLLTKYQVYDWLQLILAEEQTAPYYWRLVFTISFYQYRDAQILPKAPDVLPDEEHKGQVDGMKKYTVPKLSRDVGIPYFNMKRMFVGKGITRDFVAYTIFMHFHEVDLVTIQFDPGVIEKAYAYYSFFQDESPDDLTLQKLFY